MNERAPRRLPDWGRVLAALFFPSGLFIACGSARLLTWRWAVTLATLSYVCIIGFVMLMMHLDQTGASAVMRSAALPAGLAIFCGWPFVV